MACATKVDEITTAFLHTSTHVCIQKLTRIRKHTNKEERLAFVQMHRYITTAPYVRKSPLPATMLIVKVFTEFL